MQGDRTIKRRNSFDKNYPMQEYHTTRKDSKEDTHTSRKDKKD